MTELTIVGTTWRSGGTAAVSRLTLSEERRTIVVSRIKEELDAEEALYLATCNRVEVLLLRPASRPAADLVAAVYRQLTGSSVRPGEIESMRCWQGPAAIAHLFSVASGLDSAQPGEVEVRAQLRRALAVALDGDLSGPGLSQLVSQALTTARRIHRRTRIGIDKRSLAGVASELALEQAGTSAPIALVGASTTIRKCLGRLTRAGRAVLVVNRTPERARALVEELGAADRCRVVALDEFRRRPEPVAAVVTAVSAAQPVLDREALERIGKVSDQPLIIDLGVPPNVSESAAAEAGLERLGMDAVNLRAQGTDDERRAALDEARADLERELRRYHDGLAQNGLNPVIRGLGERARETLRAGLLDLLDSPASLGRHRDGQRPRLEQVAREGKVAESDDAGLELWIDQMARRLSHAPFVGLRALATSHGPEAVASFLTAVDPDLAEEYRRRVTPGRLDRNELDQAEGESSDLEGSDPEGAERDEDPIVPAGAAIR